MASDKAQDPADLLIAFEEASTEPIRPEYVEGTFIVPPQPNHLHNKAAYKLTVQLDVESDLAGLGNGYRVGPANGKPLALLIPDFYVLRREPSDLDEAYRRTYKGWYPIDMLALAGEVTSSNHETDTGPKLRVYATAEVPIYVLIDREKGIGNAYSEPVSVPDDPAKSHYRALASVELGGKLVLPDPYPPLDTSVVPSGR
ncbi:Uma2 family endonuclease [Streptomyces oceani]|nr:Uma2 family endonuclease [Streptomyces oceani]